MNTKTATTHVVTNVVTAGNLTHADIDDMTVKIGDVIVTKRRGDRRSKRVRVMRAFVSEAWGDSGVVDVMRIAYVEVD